MPNENYGTPLTESIISIVSDIESEHLLLPEFQRKYVWDIEHSLELFDSLVKRIHIGSLIYGKPLFDISCRKFNTSSRSLKKNSKQYRDEEKSREYPLTKNEIDKYSNTTKPYHLLLDGQQRITAIYRALKKNPDNSGIDDIWFVAKDDDKLLSSCKSNKKSLEELLDHFSEKCEPNKICILLSDVYYFNEELEEEKRKIYNKLPIDFQNMGAEKKKEYFTAFLYIFSKLSDLFKAENLVSFFLLDMDFDKFILFFERSNSTGVALNFIDILTAKVYSGFKFGQKITDFNNEHNFELLQDIPVRAIAYLKSKGHEIDKNYILKNITATDLNDKWSSITKSYANVVNYLISCNYIEDLNDLPYSNMLLTLVILAYHLKENSLNDLNEKQKEIIDWWYWSTALTKHYTSASNESIMLDANCLLSLLGKNFVEPKIERFFNELDVKNKITSSKIVEEMIVTRNPIYIGIMGLIHSENHCTLNWKNNGPLTSGSKVDSHHIFPKKYLSTLGVDSDDIDRVVNRVIIYKLTNEEAGGKNPPSIYLKKLLKENKNLIETLTKCFIPNPEMLLKGTYDGPIGYNQFLKDRAKLLYELINRRTIEKTENIKKIFTNLINVTNNTSSITRR